MAISRIGSASAAATTITIPAGHLNGDIIIMLAFNNASGIAPTLPAGWTSIGNSTLNVIGTQLAYKIAGSSSETSGTWTSATSLMCIVYRGVSTNKLPIATQSTNGKNNANNNTSVLWQALQPMQCGGTSWVIAFAAIKSINTGIESCPSPLTNFINVVSATDEIAAADSNGTILSFINNGGNYTSSLGASVGGTAGAWHTWVFELMADQLAINNYQFVKVGNGMSASSGLR